MHFRRGFRRWRAGLARICKETQGIARMVGVPLYVLNLLTSLITQLAYIGFGTKKRHLGWFTDLCVFVVLIASILIYCFVPSLAWLGTIFSASTVIAMLNIVLMQGVFGPIQSPERSLLLFICNLAQITVMFATWYSLYRVHDPLLQSILTLATISHVNEMKPVAMAQIATDFLLLAVFLSQLIGQLGPKNRGE
jgi:hypothetical protein